MRDTPGNEAELELECLSNSSPAPGVCVSRNNKAVVQQGFRRVHSVRDHIAGQLYAIKPSARARVCRTVLRRVWPARAFLLASLVKSALRSAFASTASTPRFLFLTNRCQSLIDRSSRSRRESGGCINKLELKQRQRMKIPMLDLARMKRLHRSALFCIDCHANFNVPEAISL